ncbi:MAG: bifunctional prephenate dehydrogenase/3-phosphoshikimate 1-carboxyvinyltransferase, partial [Gammaproteobacteria bacterium]|nr:bifunctional prephenate dehydrogenase/3-phosphoshikimate 1-carboxyvinyltransferase [Gammaproteobacteria bacterium]
GSIEAADVVPQADLVVIAVPTLAVPAIFEQIRSHLSAAAVVTDVASVKQSVMAAASEKLGDLAHRFVPGHPIAGSERSGFRAADGDLFINRRIIVTPGEQTDSAAVHLVHALWRTLGGNIVGMTVHRHDQVLAATSHLPHLLSYALVDVLVSNRQSEDIFRYAAGGFADFSRLASSDPTMWADIFTANADATTAVLDEYIEHLSRLRNALVGNDYQMLLTTFTTAKSTRDSFIRKLNTTMQSEPQDHKKPIDYQVNPGGQLSGQFRVPGDKSISHRAIIFGSLAEGVTRVSGFLEGEDALNTLEAFREMGVTAIGPEQGELTLYGVGMQGLQAPRKPLYMGNSGTAMRLLAGLLSAQAFASVLTGDESLSSRPMKRIADPLRLMGAHIETTQAGTPPLEIEGASLHGIDYQLPMASAQVKSCLLLAAMYAGGQTTIRQPAVCRDHTERLLQGFGYPIEQDQQNGIVQLSGGHSLKAANIDIPGDISSAAFFLVGASIAPGSKLRLEHIGINPTRTGIIDLLQLMGADIQLLNSREAGGEPVADLLVTHAGLRGIDIPQQLIPLAIDEFPALFIAAACAEGTTRLRGAEELRVKESDRLQAMADGLRVLGIEHQLYEDGIDITGGQLGGGEIDSQGDHRIAMAFAMASLCSSAPIVIRNCANVATSFPGFVELARAAGLQLQSQQASGSANQL